MPIFRGDRDEGSLFTAIVVNGVEKRYLHLRANTLNSDSVGEAYSLYRNRQGQESLDMLTFTNYGKSRLQWVFAEVNELISLWDIDEVDSFIVPSRSFMSKY